MLQRPAEKASTNRARLVTRHAATRARATMPAPRWCRGQLLALRCLSAIATAVTRNNAEDTASQAVGFVEDGSMVVMGDSKHYVGRRVQAEIISVLPTAGGKMIFARLLSPA